MSAPARIERRLLGFSAVDWSILIVGLTLTAFLTLLI